MSHFMLSSTCDHRLELMNSSLTFMDISLEELTSIFLEAYYLGSWTEELDFQSVVLSFYIMLVLTRNLNGYWVEGWFGKCHRFYRKLNIWRRDVLNWNLICFVGNWKQFYMFLFGLDKMFCFSCILSVLNCKILENFRIYTLVLN